MPWWALRLRQRAAVDVGVRRAGHACGRRTSPVPPVTCPRWSRSMRRPDRARARVRRADGSGDVYFDVRSWPAYGELTGRRIDDMEPAADADPRGKRDPRDFALWKGAQAGRAVVADPVGRRASGLAPRVLGDGGQVPRRRVRHPRRRHRPAVPAPRERAWRSRRAVGQRVRALLDAQRLGHDGGREDEQVAGQQPARHRGASAGAAGRAALLPRWRRTTAATSSTPTRR